MPTYNVTFVGEYATLTTTVEVGRKERAERTARELVKTFYGIDVLGGGLNDDVVVELAY